MIHRDIDSLERSWSDPRPGARTATRLDRWAGSTMGRAVRRPARTDSMVEALEPRVLLAGDHSSFGDFPNTGANDTVTFDQFTGRGAVDGIIESLYSELNDLFKFTIPTDDFVTVRADATNAASTLNTKIRVYTASAQNQPVLVGQSSGDGVLTAGTPTDAWFGFVALAGTTYYAVVEGEAGALTGAYTIRVASRSTGVLTDGATGEASAGGTVVRPGDDTVYRITSGSGSLFDSVATFNATAVSNDPAARVDTRIDIYNASGTLVAADSQSGRRNDAFLALKSDPDALYYVRVRSDEFLVSRSQFATGDYFIAIDLAANDFATLIDPILRRVSDTAGALNEFLGFETALYKFTAQGTGRMIATAVRRGIFNPLINPALRILDSAGVQLAFNDDLYGVVPQIEFDVIGGRQYEIIVDNFIGNPGETDYSLFVEAQHTFDAGQPVDDHPNTPDPNGALTNVKRQFQTATPLLWGSPFLLTDAVDLPIKDHGWLTDAYGTGRIYGTGDTDLFQFTPQVDMLGDYIGSNSDAGTALYVGGQFLHAGTITSTIEATSNRIAAYDANDWWTARLGLNGTVRAMAQFDDDGDGVPSLIVGGDFTKAANTTNPAQDITVNGLAKWTFIPSAGDYQWRAFGAGVAKGINPGSVRALAVWDPEAYGSSPDLPPTLVIGGDFTSLNGTAMTNLGMFVMGGGFAPFEGALPVAAGAGARVNAIMAYIQDPPDPDGVGPKEDPDPLLYLAVGGSFTNGITEWGPNRNPLAQARVIRNMAGGGTTGVGAGGIVNALLPFDPPDPDGADPTKPDPGPLLVVGGTFTSRGNRVATWNGNTDAASTTPGWQNLPGAVSGNGVNNTVNALAAWDGEDPDGTGPEVDPPNMVVAGGAFTSASGAAVGRVAAYVYPSPTSTWPAGWGPPISPSQGFYGGFTDPDPLKAPVIYSLAVMTDSDTGINPGPMLYAGGEFQTADTLDANRVAKLLWDSNNGYVWRQMGTGAKGPAATSDPYLTNNGVSDTVFAMAEFDDGNPNYWDRHERPSGRLNIVVQPDFGPFLNTSIRVFDSSMNLVAENGLYQNDDLDATPWSSQLPDASTFPFDTSRSGMIDPSLALPGSVIDNITGIEVWAGETYYVEVSATPNQLPIGRYTVRVTASAYVPEGPNNTLVDTAPEPDFTNAFQFAQPVSTGDARNFITPPNSAMSGQFFVPGSTDTTITELSELGNIHSVGETDLYSFRAQASGTAEVRINTTQCGDDFREYINGVLTSSKAKDYDSALDSTVRIYKADFEQIAYNNDNPAVTGEPSLATPVGTFGTRVFHKRDSRIVFPIIEGEVYYIAVGSGQRWVDGSFANPALRVEKTVAEIDWRHAIGAYEILLNSMSDLDPAVDDHEYEGSFQLSTPIAVGTDLADPATNGKAAFSGIVNSALDDDSFFFVAPARGTATLRIGRQAGSTVVPVVLVLDYPGNQVVTSGAGNSNGDLTLTFPVTPGERFNIRVFGNGGSTGGYAATLAGMAFVDDFVDSTDLSHPTAIPQLDFQGNGTVLGSLEQPGDTDIFKFTTSDFAVMTLSLSTTTVTLNPYLTVYEVTLDPTLNPILVRIAFNDDQNINTRNSRVSFSVTPNRTTLLTDPPSTYPWYYVVVSGAEPSTDYGAYTLRLDFPATDDHPDADEYAYASSIAVDANSGVGTSAGVTENLADSDLFQFVAPAGGQADVTVTRPANSLIVPKVSVIEYLNGTGTVLASGLWLGSEASTGLFDVVRGSTYFVLVENTGTTFGDYTVTVNAPPVDDYPNIDEFSIASTIPLSAASGDGFVGTDTFPSSDNPRLSPVNDTDLFKFVPLSNGPTVVRLTSYSTPVGRFAPRLRLFDFAQNPVVDGDLSNNTLPTASEPSVVTIALDTLIAGQTYYVLVSAVAGLPPPAALTGEYKLFVDTFVPDGGDGGGPGSINFDNPGVVVLDSRTGRGEHSDLVDASGDRDLFTFTAPTDGPAFVQVVTPMGSVLDCSITILNAPNENLSSVVTSNGNGIPGATASVSFNAVADQQYWAIVAGVGSGVGAYSIRVKFQPVTEYLYFPEGYASPAIREFVSISNNNAYEVSVKIWAYYEAQPDGQGGFIHTAPTDLTGIFTNANGRLVFAPGARNGITTSAAGNDYDSDPANDSEGRRAGLVPGIPYALVIESTGPIGATMAHYDFGATIGDSFTGKTSATWTFARVEKNPGAVEDYLLYFNPNSFKVRVSATAYTSAGLAIALPDRDLEQNERSGLAIDQLPVVPTGIVGVTVRAAVHPDEGSQPDFLGIVASQSHYDKAGQAGYGFIGDDTGGSVSGAITSLTNGDSVVGELTIYNPGDSPAVVNLTGSYVTSNLPDLVRVLPIPAHNNLVLRGDDLNFARNQPVGLRWTSNVPVTMQSAQTQNGEADAAGAAHQAGQAFFFGDGFMNSAFAGQLYFETLSFYNPTALDTFVQVKLLFTGINDFITASVPVKAHGFGQLKLHELQDLIVGRPGISYYSIQASAPVPFASTLTHYDLYLRGGFTTAGAPLGLLNDLTTIPT